jgi:hemolysin III
MRTNSLNEKEFVSSMTHLAGALCAAGGAVFLAVKGILDNVAPLQMAALIIFSLSMTALYSCSGIYHLSKARGFAAGALRKLDHAMIYVLIAGSYTPICLFYLPINKAIIFVLVIWGVAIFGIIAKMFWISAPNYISAIIYILMGWAVVFDFKSFWLFNAQGMLLVAIGGIAYTMGGIIYAIKRPNFGKFFGFHEFFHVFVLLGSFFHFAAVFFFMA